MFSKARNVHALKLMMANSNSQAMAASEKWQNECLTKKRNKKKSKDTCMESH